MTPPGFFSSFFQNFDFLGCWWGKRAKDGPKEQKNSVFQASYLRTQTYDCNLWYTCVKLRYIQAFFLFFQNFDFLVVRRAKGQK